ncbi:hypothetical protein P3T40_007498 [Paraburkholderia sp. EB58]|jgi:hypothetical protein
MISQICAVLVYVPDVPAALDWYQSAFRGAELRFLDEFNLTYLEFNGVRLEIVPAMRNYRRAQQARSSIGVSTTSTKHCSIFCVLVPRFIAGQATWKLASRCACYATLGRIASGFRLSRTIVDDPARQVEGPQLAEPCPMSRTPELAGRASRVGP